jgi:subtilase family serine protease
MGYTHSLVPSYFLGKGLCLRRLTIVLSLIALLSAITIGTSSRAFAQTASPATQKIRTANACGDVSVGKVRCFAELVLNPGALAHHSLLPNASGSVSGYGPADIQSAYNLPSATAGQGQTVAIVDAFDDPNAESDLAVYRSQFGLPPCTTANGCFRKVDQNGGTNYPPQDSGWDGEISLDLDMVSATCPNCHILLVEAGTADFSNLATAVNTAASLGADAISNSYGGSEDSSETSYAEAYDHPGVAITVSTGDSGYGTAAPSVFSTVTAVGGTSLYQGFGYDPSSRGWSETAWSGTGSGCSQYISKPSWQTDQGCSMRTVADVAAVADPNTGVAVYDTVSIQGQSGWLVFGGTSVSSPIISSVYALAGNAKSLNIDGASYIYSHTDSLNDITFGFNGFCNPLYLCTAGPGYDGPTGWGTPNGVGAF